MKLIKPGRDQKGWSKELDCTGGGHGGGGCGALLLVEEPDLFITCEAAEDISREIGFACMNCGVVSDIKKIPYEVSYRVKKRK